MAPTYSLMIHLTTCPSLLVFWGWLVTSTFIVIIFHFLSPTREFSPSLHRGADRRLSHWHVQEATLEPLPPLCGELSAPTADLQQAEEISEVNQPITPSVNHRLQGTLHGPLSLRGGCGSSGRKE